MANSLPFNAVAVDGEYDRVYKAEDWAWYFATFIANGIFPKPSDGLQVVAYSGMEIRVNAGYAFINGYAFRNPATLSVTLDTAEGALNRVDRVVVRWDLPQRDMYIAVLKGTPSAKPTATAVTRTTEIWELALADIYVGKGVTRIQTQNITDQRFNSAVCGIVTGTVEEIDASVLTKQFTDFFNTYSAAVLDEFSAYKQSMEKYLRLLVDDVTKTDARALLNVNKMATISDIVAPSNEYIYASGANELTVVEDCVIAVGGAGIFKTANTILTAANLDAGSAFAVGKDYYVYICDSRIDSADEKYVISLNSTYPTGWNATNSRKIGGFHYGRCRKVDSNLQPLNGSSVIFGTGWESAVSNGIVPRSVWTLGHRPKCSPEGMVYLGGGTWVDIYLNSDDGAKGLKSEYGCAPMTGTESMNWYNFVERLAKSGKRLPNYAEFCAYAFGSPAGLDNANTNAWSAASNTGRGVTGSVVNAVSSVGVVDAVGRVWEWLDELITRAEHATNADYHASVAWGWDKKSPLNTGEKSYDVGNIYQYYAYSLAALIAGSGWNDGANCGARAVHCGNYPWDVTNSCAGIDGAIRKVGMLISLVFMLAIDVLIKINLIGFIPEQARTYLGLDTVGVAEFFALLYIAYEVVSIFKNMALCGLPVKKVWEKVREFLAKYTDELPDTDELDGDSTTGNVEEHRTQER